MIRCKVQFEFSKQQKSSREATRRRAQQSPTAEKLQRFRRIIQQEFDTDQIQHNGDSSRETVIRFAALPRQVLDRNLCNACTGPACQCRNKAMQFAVEMEILDGFAPVSFERRPEIMQVEAAKTRHEPVRGAARKLPSQPGIVPLKPPAADNVVSLAHLGNERRDFDGIVLKISIHRNNDVASRKIEAGFQARSLSEILS